MHGDTGIAKSVLGVGERIGKLAEEDIKRAKQVGAFIKQRSVKVLLSLEHEWSERYWE